MIQEPFSAGDSQIHCLDARLKVVFVTVYSFVVALLNSFPAMLAAFGLSVFIIAMANLNIWKIVRRLMIVNGMIVCLWFVLPFTVPGKTLFMFGPLPITFEGVLLSLKISIKSNAILLSVITLVASSPVTTLGQALNRLRMPEKLVHLMLLTYRYVFVLEQESQRLLRAAKSRGFRPGNNLHTYRTYAYLVGMLFVHAISRAQTVHQAMLCRGFKGKFYCLSEFSFTQTDIIWSVVMLIAIAGLEIIEWTC